MDAPGAPEYELAELRELRALLPEVRAYAARHVPSTWPELQRVLDPLLSTPLGPLGILPLASCGAAGGDPREAIPVAAAWEVLSLAVRILDDLQDRDNPGGLWVSVGPPRAFNFSAGLYALCSKMLASAPWPPEQYHRVSAEFFEGALQTAAGQDSDLLGGSRALDLLAPAGTRSLDDYWRIMGAKNGAMFAAVCAAGALCATGSSRLAGACRDFGYHVGLALQIFDDLEGIWEPLGVGDLEANKLTMPVFYGLSTDHPRREELRGYVESGRVADFSSTIREILDSINTRRFMVWTALKERTAALDSLQDLPAAPGISVLRAYVTAMFANIDALVG